MEQKTTNLAGPTPLKRQGADSKCLTDPRKQLSAKCPNLVADLPEATRELGLTVCDQLAAEG